MNINSYCSSVSVLDLLCDSQRPLPGTWALGAGGHNGDQVSKGWAVLEAEGHPSLQVTALWPLGQCVTILCVRASPQPAAQATDSSPTSRRTPAAPATAVVRGPVQGEWDSDHLGRGVALQLG